MANVITWAVFLLGLALGGYSWAAMSQWPLTAPMDRLIRFVLCPLIAMAFFSCVTYILWLAGVELEMGIIRSGKMASHWWLPPVTVFVAVHAWRSIRPRVIPKAGKK